MKTRLSLFLASVLAMVAIPIAASAAPTTTVVVGKVTNNGKGVALAKVVVVCDNHSKHTVTGLLGNYVVDFPAVDCPNGADANVVATKGGLGGVNSAPVKNYDATDNVAIVDVQLPEFGIIAGISAAVIGTGAFFAIRRRQISGHKA